MAAWRKAEASGSLRSPTFLGVSKQRAHQIAEEKGFPTPVGREGQSRQWDRREIVAWTKEWRREKPWR
jgi:hypothetical protein